MLHKKINQKKVFNKNKMIKNILQLNLKIIKLNNFMNLF